VAALSVGGTGRGRSAPDRIDQARTLFRLQPKLDSACLDRHIREETAADHGIEALEQE
jgi:hypothetical protein